MRLNFSWQNNNEFRSSVRWHDYVAIIIHEFDVFKVRRYDWGLHSGKRLNHTWIIALLGVTLSFKTKMKE